MGLGAAYELFLLLEYVKMSAGHMHMHHYHTCLHQPCARLRLPPGFADCWAPQGRSQTVVRPSHAPWYTDNPGMFRPPSRLAVHYPWHVHKAPASHFLPPAE